MAQVTSGSPSLFWRLDQPLILASASATRRRILAECGVPLTIQPAEVDERAVEQSHPSAGLEMASVLAHAKALEVSARSPGRLVLGADQTLHCDDTAYHKPANHEAAARQLIGLAGKEHILTSAFCVAIDNRVMAEGAVPVRMRMRPITADFIATYLRQAGDDVLGSVGCYQIEGLGSQLFDTIEGDHFSVLGLPLLKVLAALRQLGALAE
jgi:septum formation protein